MSILSLEFLILTLGTVIVYYIVPLKVRWCVLLVSSGVFYAMAGWQGCIWIVVVAAITFLSSLLQHKLLQKERKIAEAEDLIREAKEREEQRLAAAQAEVSESVSGTGEDAATCSSLADMAQTAETVETAETAEEAEAPIPVLPKRGWFSSSAKSKTLRKILLAVTIILPFAAMAFVKYYDALRAWIVSMPELSLIVPLGLSYFTFQSVGYTVDIYRGKYEPAKNPLKYLLFVSFYPQLPQGPISPYPQLMPQLEKGNRFNPDNFVMGFQLAMWGFFKKMVLADRLVTVTDAINVEQRGWMILLTVIIYAIRLYADFSGGMDVIRGAAKMMGIDMVENFRRPFFSFSVAEYWRRWHISLGVWFRSYLFYPITTSTFGLWLSKIGKKLFGKKAGRGLPATISTIIIFFLIGIWHTANGNALVFGLYFGLVLGIEILLDPLFKKMKKKLGVNEKSFPWKFFTLLRTWVLIIIPQYFAFTKDPQTGLALLGATFKNWKLTNVGVAFTSVDEPLNWYIAAGAFLIMLVVDIICEKKPDLNNKLARGPFFVRWPILLLLILIVLIYGCYGTGYDPSAFLYTNF